MSERQKQQPFTPTQIDLTWDDDVDSLIVRGSMWASSRVVIMLDIWRSDEFPTEITKTLDEARALEAALHEKLVAAAPPADAKEDA